MFFICSFVSQSRKGFVLLPIQVHPSNLSPFPVRLCQRDPRGQAAGPLPVYKFIIMAMISFATVLISLCANDGWTDTYLGGEHSCDPQYQQKAKQIGKWDQWCQLSSNYPKFSRIGVSTWEVHRESKTELGFIRADLLVETVDKHKDMMAEGDWDLANMIPSRQKLFNLGN